MARSIVTNDLEAEVIIQAAYVRAYEHLNQFEDHARFSTWLTKIAIYEAYARMRRIDYQKVDSISFLEGQVMDVKAQGRNPEQQISDGELRMLLEKAFDPLSDVDVNFENASHGIALGDNSWKRKANQFDVTNAAAALQKQRVREQDARTRQMSH